MFNNVEFLFYMYEVYINFYRKIILERILFSRGFY